MGFLAALTGFESGNRNIPNTTRGTSSGQAQGNFQITTGTWNDFAPDAGVDLRKYPTPLSAPPAVQWRVASTIPMRRWAPETLAALRAQGYSISPDLSLGENVAANGGSAAKWFSGTAYAAGAAAAPPGRFDLGSTGQAGGATDPFAEFAAAEKAASSLAPTNATAGVGARFNLSSAPASSTEDPFGELIAAEQGKPTQSVGVSAAQPSTGPLTSAAGANPGMQANLNLGLTGLREQAAQSSSATSPATPPPGSLGAMLPEQLTAPGGGLEVMNSIPVVGPSILKAGAGVNALLNGDSYDAERALQAQQMQQFEAAYPKTATGAEIAGGLAGTGAAVGVAPAAFGIGTGYGAGANALLAAGTNAGLNAIDTGIRGGSASNIERSAAIGALGGAGGALLGSGLNAVGRALTGGAMPADDAALAALARDKYGIPLTNDQLSGDTGQSFLRSSSDRLPFSGAQNDMANTQAAFNRAVAETIGEGGSNKLTPAVMNAAKARIGQAFDDVASRTAIKITPQFDNDLLSVVSQAQDSGMSADELRPINKIFDNVLDAINPKTRTISGDVYQTLTRTGTPLGNALKSANPNIKNVAGEIKDALDDALGRSASPQDLQEFQTAKSQWRNLKTIEPNVAQNGGNVSPARLASDINNSRFSKAGLAYGNGGDLGELAAIGQRFMKAPQSSGTAERLASLGALGSILSGGNALMSGSLAGAAHGLGFVPAALAVNRYAVNPALRSSWLANALINRSLPGGASVGPSIWPAIGAGLSSGANALLSGAQ